jgi:hypothetical protein
MQFGCQLDPQAAVRISAALPAQIWHNRNVIQALEFNPQAGAHSGTSPWQ